ncbi:DUF7521 family protein [Haloglomus halophilum]|uniref:DUF7521 family protein n=1 Tax=Haloglomus halophilum TaxID=2962672 RepID=UPI0020C9E14E|nr:hypothetical protein [Haloglomus halophilum]
MVNVLNAVLVLMRLILFGLSLGLTVISFQSYQRRQSQRLQYAFIGFAFISMGVAVTNLSTQIGTSGAAAGTELVLIQISETIPFIIGFAMIYLSLYR